MSTLNRVIKASLVYSGIISIGMLDTPIVFVVSLDFSEIRNSGYIGLL